jgi:hypothetical protein
MQHITALQSTTASPWLWMRHARRRAATRPDRRQVTFSTQGARAPPSIDTPPKPRACEASLRHGEPPAKSAGTPIGGDAVLPIQDLPAPHEHQGAGKVQANSRAVSPEAKNLDQLRPQASFATAARRQFVAHGAGRLVPLRMCRHRLSEDPGYAVRGYHLAVREPSIERTAEVRTMGLTAALLVPCPGTLPNQGDSLGSSLR